MKAISIRQPWAWLILYAGKDIENRSWSTNYRGPILIHASKGMTCAEYEDARSFAKGLGYTGLPLPENLLRGGIVGRAELVDCLDHSTSPWYMGGFGFLLRSRRHEPFRPMRGALGLFEVPDE